MRAMRRDNLIAVYNHTLVVEGNHCFPHDSHRREHIRDSSRRSVCPWKGIARYFDVVVCGDINPGWHGTTLNPHRRLLKFTDILHSGEG